mgnify:CR=1 FL=1
MDNKLDPTVNSVRSNYKLNNRNMKKNKLSELEFVQRLTPEFRDHFERFIPQWLDSLVPHYEEAKEKGAETFHLVNVKNCGNDFLSFEKNGIGYYLSEQPYIKEMTFNSDYKYKRCGWYECFCEFYPRLESDFDERISNFREYNCYMTKYLNKKEEYSCMAEWVNEYFKSITKDPNVYFILSDTSTICLTDRGVSWAKWANPLE